MCDCTCYLFPHPTGFRNKVLFPTITLKDIGAWQGPDRKHLTIIEILTQKKVLLIKYLTTIDNLNTSVLRKNKRGGEGERANSIYAITPETLQ